MGTDRVMPRVCVSARTATFKLASGGWGRDLRQGLLDGGRGVSTDRAVRVAPNLDLGEASGLRVEGEKSPDERLAVSRYQFECLVRLETPDDAWEHAQDPCLASGRGQFGGWSLRIQTPVARPLERDERRSH